MLKPSPQLKNPPPTCRLCLPRWSLEGYLCQVRLRSSKRHQCALVSIDLCNAHPSFHSSRVTSYQRLYFRNANHSIARPSVTERRQDVRSSTEGGEDKKWVDLHRIPSGKALTSAFLDSRISSMAFDLVRRLQRSNYATSTTRC